MCSTAMAAGPRWEVAGGRGGGEVGFDWGPVVLNVPAVVGFGGVRCTAACFHCLTVPPCLPPFPQVLHAAGIERPRAIVVAYTARQRSVLAVESLHQASTTM